MLEVSNNSEKKGGVVARTPNENTNKQVDLLISNIIENNISLAKETDDAKQTEYSNNMTLADQEIGDLIYHCYRNANTTELYEIKCSLENAIADNRDILAKYEESENKNNKTPVFLTRNELLQRGNITSLNSDLDHHIQNIDLYLKEIDKETIKRGKQEEILDKINADDKFVGTPIGFIIDHKHVKQLYITGSEHITNFYDNIKIIFEFIDAECVKMRGAEIKNANTNPLIEILESNKDLIEKFAYENIKVSYKNLFRSSEPSEIMGHINLIGDLANALKINKMSDPITNGIENIDNIFVKNLLKEDGYALPDVINFVGK